MIMTKKYADTLAIKNRISKTRPISFEEEFLSVFLRADPY
jgi:hypothetical protein